jgi:hypothetical protein
MSSVENKKTTEPEIIAPCPHCNKSSVRDNRYLIKINDGGSIQCYNCRKYWHYCKKEKCNSPCLIGKCDVQCTPYSNIQQTYRY